MANNNILKEIDSAIKSNSRKLKITTIKKYAEDEFETNDIWELASDCIDKINNRLQGLEEYYRLEDDI